MARGPLYDPFERQWRWLLEYGNAREKALVHRLYVEPRVRFYCPYPTSNEIHLSRNTAYPWDDNGMPFVVAESDGTYSVRNGDGGVHVRVTIDEVAAGLLALLEQLEPPRRSDRRPKDLPQGRDRRWRSLATTSSDPEVRFVAERLAEEPEVRRYYPYTSMSNVKLSRNDEYPWDDEGLPRLIRREEGEYVVVDGEGELRGTGGLESAVAAFVRLLADIRISTRGFQQTFCEALQHGGGAGELLEIVCRFKRLGLGQQEAYDAIDALRPGLPEPVEDLLVEVLDIVTGWCSPKHRIWEATRSG
ncbi:MAG: hypothetical protein HOV81_44730 [Kofleriaceae bacterium]|nr:hypothetical protein [Kofleriaceae bacterium]